MRINDRYSSTREVIPESQHFLQRIIEEIRYNPPPPIENVPPDKIEPVLAEFFEKYYVPLGSEFIVQTDREPPTITISNYEKRILDYCKDPRSETRICVFHGHTGVGKSTLLHRIIYYIYPQCPSLRKEFYPIYIRMSPDLISKEPDEAFHLIANIVCQNTYKVIKGELQRDPVSILSRINENGKFSYGKLSKSSIQEATDDFEKWFATFAITRNSRIDFLLDILEILIQEKKIKPIVFVDDVDTYDSIVHACTFLALDMLTPYGIWAVATMRTSTFESHSARFLQWHDKCIELSLSPDLIYSILKRRIDATDITFKLHPDLAYRISKFEEVKGGDVVDAFNRLISGPQCISTLISLSNTNIKSIFLKLDLMAKSEAFSDTFIVHQLLEREVVESHKELSKTWVFYHLLFGNAAGTNKMDPEALKAGIINVFDSSIISNNPWCHFIRLCILMHLYKKWRLSRNIEAFTSCSEIIENIKLAFGTSLRTSFFIDALSILVQSELVFTQSCLRYSPDTLNVEILSDSLRISTAGRFYIENIIKKVEYLYFMKDDIEWDLSEFPEDMTPAGRDYRRKVKFTSVLEALILLLQKENSALASLKASWICKEEYHDALSRYRDQFSPYGLPETSGVLFCGLLINSYSSYMKSTLGEQYKGSDVEKKFKAIEDIIDANESLYKAFYQA